MVKVWGMRHLFVTVFLHFFSTCMVDPAITDVTMAALCPGQNECSLAIYLTGTQQTIMGLGTLVVLPLIGYLSDTHGRKAMLTIPMALTILPVAVLAYSRTRNYFYAYFVLKTLTAMICEGSVFCLALAYVADYMPEHRRASVIGILSGIGSLAFICGNLFARYLSHAATFQVSTLVATISIVYMKLLLPESTIPEDDVNNPIVREGELNVTLLEEDEESKKHVKIFKRMPSLGDTISLLRSSLLFTQAAVVAFFSNLGGIGSHVSLNYFLKARFDFNKNQFADIMVIAGIAGTVSQMIIMPALAPVAGEKRLLLIGLIFSSLNMFLYSIAWAPWVPYVATTLSLFAAFAQPSILSIVSKLVGPSEQGKAQGCISGICSLAHVVAPLIFSHLTALFLSPDAPIPFPGFSIMCAGFAVVIAFVQSIMIRLSAPVLILE